MKRFTRSITNERRQTTIGTQEIRSKLVQNGKFRAFEDGTIFRVKKNGKEVPAAITYVSRSRNRGRVSFCENGKQKHVYVSRLVAEAFCDNTNNYPQVGYKDGDSLNNHASNLVWCTPSQRTIRAYGLGLLNHLRNAKLCRECKQPTITKDGTCPACKLNAKRTTEHAAASKKALEKAQKGLVGINFDTLDARCSKIVSLRQEGKTFKQIGNELCVSRQCVQQVLSRVINRARKRSERSKPHARTRTTRRPTRTSASGKHEADATD